MLTSLDIDKVQREKFSGNFVNAENRPLGAGSVSAKATSGFRVRVAIYRQLITVDNSGLF